MLPLQPTHPSHLHDVANLSLDLLAQRVAVELNLARALGPSGLAATKDREQGSLGIQQRSVSGLVGWGGVGWGGVGWGGVSGVGESVDMGGNGLQYNCFLARRSKIESWPGLMHVLRCVMEDAQLCMHVA